MDWGLADSDGIEFDSVMELFLVAAVDIAGAGMLVDTEACLVEQRNS